MPTPAAPPVLTLPIRDVLVATPRSRIVRLDTGGSALEFRAGQSVLVGRQGQPLRKPYSIACAPAETRVHQWIELLVQVGDTGAPGAHLDDLRSGVPVAVAGPFGTFYFPDEPAERRFLFIAGGTGIAPLRSMLRHVLLAFPPGERKRVGVVYSARSPDEFAYADELDRLARRGDIELRRTVTRTSDVTWQGDRGRISAHSLAPMIDDPATLCFVCGPPTLLQEVPPLLGRLGIPSTRIKMEEWDV